MEKIIKNKLNTDLEKKEDLLLWIMCKAYEKIYDQAVTVNLPCSKNEKTYDDHSIIDEIISDMTIKGYSLYKLGMKVDSFMEKNSRVKTGSFYTPEPLARGIIKITLSDYFKFKDYGLYNFFRNFDKQKQYDNDMLKHSFDSIAKLKVVDLSCGSGIFLIGYLNLIIDIYELIQKQDLDNNLTRYDMSNMYGFDIQSAPIGILKLSLMDLAFRNDFIHSDVSNIRICNSLLDDIEKDFDIVLGNPPYIGEKGNRAIFIDMKKTAFGKKYYEGKMDYFYYFMYKGTEILKKDGILGYITTNYFTTADGATNLREFISKGYRFETLINFNDIILFPSAPGQHNMVFTMTRNDRELEYVESQATSDYRGTCISVVSKCDEFDTDRLCNLNNIKSYILEYNKVFNDRNKIVLTPTEDFHSILDKIIKISNKSLGDFISVKQGIVSGADKVSRLMIDKKLNELTMEKYNIQKDDPIFVFDLEQQYDIEEELLMPFYKNSDINRYKVNKYTEKRIIYIGQEIDSFESLYPKAYSHLLKYKSVLDLRREVKNGTKPWYCLQWGREKELFEEERIVAPQRSIKNCFGYGVKRFYASADVYYLKVEDYFEIDPKSLNYYLLGILNSKLYYFWLYNMGKRKGNLLELYSKPISEIPVILDGKGEFFSSIVSLVTDIMMDNGDIIEKQSLIDALIYKEFRLDEDEIVSVKSLYSTMLGKTKS